MLLIMRSEAARKVKTTVAADAQREICCFFFLFIIVINYVDAYKSSPAKKSELIKKN